MKALAYLTLILATYGVGYLALALLDALFRALGVG